MLTALTPYIFLMWLQKEEDYKVWSDMSKKERMKVMGHVCFCQYPESIPDSDDDSDDMEEPIYAFKFRKDVPPATTDDEIYIPIRWAVTRSSKGKGKGNSKEPRPKLNGKELPEGYVLSY